MTRVLLPAFWTAVLLAVAVPAVAHEGHDHDAPPPSQSIVSAPRAETASENVELVVVARGAELELYLDDFRTNAPIENATIEVETTDGQVVAKPEAGRPYRLPAPWAAKPGRYDLVVTVTVGTILEVLPVTLSISEAPVLPANATTNWVDAAFAGAGTAKARLPAAPLAVGIGFSAGLAVMWLVLRRRRSVVPVAVLVMLASSGAVLA